jgi:hypothetical protein
MKMTLDDDDDDDDDDSGDEELIARCTPEDDRFSMLEMC